jgi:hypothetical protein
MSALGAKQTLADIRSASSSFGVSLVGGPDQSLDVEQSSRHCEGMIASETPSDTSRDKSIRFRSRPANRDWLVLDTWTGEPAQIGGIAQVGLSKVDADHMAALLQAQTVTNSR